MVLQHRLTEQLACPVAPCDWPVGQPTHAVAADDGLYEPAEHAVQIDALPSEK